MCLAAPQAAVYQLLVSEGWLSDEEASLMRWATNSASVAPPSHATRQQYKQATAVEALVREPAEQWWLCRQCLPGTSLVIGVYA
jgi:23S rRNA maturation mini-RNase III